MADHTYQFYLHANRAWAAIYEACAAARASILFEHFIFIDDQSGRPFIDLFKQKVKEGVKVKMLLDAFGSTQVFPFPLEKELIAAGVEIEFFNTLIPGTIRYLHSWFFRDHRKLVVVDSKVAFTGGVCFQEHMKDWRDTCVRIEGPVVVEIERSFYNMWRRTRREPRERDHYERLGPERPFVFLTCAPFTRRRYLYYELLERIKRAKSSIRFTTPYFVPNHKLTRALVRAARRGVRVELLIPADSDQFLVDLAAQSYFAALLKAGIEIYQSGQPFNHTKAGTIDGHWGTLGSLNLDYLSLRYNFEANLVTNEIGFIEALDEHFRTDSRAASQLELAVWEKRPYYRQLLELLIRPLRFLF